MQILLVTAFTFKTRHFQKKIWISKKVVWRKKSSWDLLQVATVINHLTARKLFDCGAGPNPNFSALLPKLARASEKKVEKEKFSMFWITCCWKMPVFLAYLNLFDCPLILAWFGQFASKIEFSYFVAHFVSSSYVKPHLTFTLPYFQVSYSSFATSHEVHSKVINFPILVPIFHHFWLFLRENSKQRRKMLFSFRFGPPQGGPALIVSRLCNSIKVRWAPTAHWVMMAKDFSSEKNLLNHACFLLA